MDAESMLKDWANYVERSYPKWIAEAKGAVLRARIIGVILYLLAIYMWYSAGEESTRAYFGIIPFIIGSIYLSQASNDHVKRLEEGRVAVARFMGRGDYASVITWQSIGDTSPEVQRRYQELKTAGIDLFDRSQAESKAREAEGLRY